MAKVIIGGRLFSVSFALLITLVSYSSFDSLGLWLGRLKAKASQTMVPAVAPVAVAASTQAITTGLQPLENGTQR